MSINLQPFCADSSDPREYLHRPAVLDGHTVATNGHILIRVPGAEPGAGETLPDWTAAGMRKMFAEEYGQFRSLPEIPARVDCGACNGTGYVETDDCDDCDGHGEFRHGEHDYECKECDGTGKVGPTQCRQRDCRDGEKIATVQIGTAKFQARYLRMIAALPNARISVRSITGPAAFVFDGGDGRVMPCRD